MNKEYERTWRKMECYRDREFMEGVVTSVEVEGVRDGNSCKQMSHPPCFCFCRLCMSDVLSGSSVYPQFVIFKH